MQYKKRSIGYGLGLKVYLGNIIQISFRVSGHKLSFNFQEAWTEAAVFIRCIILRFIMFVYIQFDS